MRDGTGESLSGRDAANDADASPDQPVQRELSAEASMKIENSHSLVDPVDERISNPSSSTAGRREAFSPCPADRVVLVPKGHIRPEFTKESAKITGRRGGDALSDQNAERREVVVMVKGKENAARDDSAEVDDDAVEHKGGRAVEDLRDVGASTVGEDLRTGRGQRGTHEARHDQRNAR